MIQGDCFILMKKNASSMHQLDQSLDLKLLEIMVEMDKETRK